MYVFCNEYLTLKEEALERKAAIAANLAMESSGSLESLPYGGIPYIETTKAPLKVIFLVVLFIVG